MDKAVRTAVRNRLVSCTMMFALVVGIFAVSPTPALSQTVDDCLTSTARGDWRVAAKAASASSPTFSVK